MGAKGKKSKKKCCGKFIKKGKHCKHCPVFLKKKKKKKKKDKKKKNRDTKKKKQ